MKFLSWAAVVFLFSVGVQLNGAEVSPSPMFLSVHKAALSNLSGQPRVDKGEGELLDFTYHPWVCVTLDPEHCTVDAFYCMTMDPNYDCTADPNYCYTADPNDPYCQYTADPVICITMDPEACTQNPYFCFTYHPDWIECDTPDFTLDPRICTTLDPEGSEYCTYNPPYCYTFYPGQWPECEPTGVEEGKKEVIKEFVISSAPNPFSEYTVITYSIPYNSYVSLKIYDSSGRLVESLVDANLSKGNYSVHLSGKSLKEGIYIAKLVAGGRTLSIKLILKK